jgi:hypothetical protein
VADRAARAVSDAQLVVTGRLTVRSPSIKINDTVATRVVMRLDGPEEALNGDGQLDFGGFSGSARSKLPIKFNCTGSDHLDVDMETNLAVGGGAFQAKMRNGRLSAEGQTGPITALAHSTGESHCKSPTIKHVVQKKGEWWTDGICSKGLNVYHCRWESPEVSYSYHFHLGVRLLSVSLLMTNPRVHLDSSGDVSVCNLGALVVTPLAIVGGYSPGIDSNYPGLDNIVNGLIQIGLESFQSVALTGIGLGLGWFVSPVATLGGNVLCIGKPL